MDFIGTAVLGVITGVASEAGKTFAAIVKHAIFGAFKNKSDAEIYAALASAGNLSEADIRKRVSELAAKKQLSVAQTEELSNLLINLARGVRARTTNGSLRSSFVRCEHLLDQLMQGILPVRKKGERLSEHSPWVLQRFLGMGTFGEVWEAGNPDYPIPHAIKFFTDKSAAQWIKAEQGPLSRVRKELPKQANLIEFLDVALDGKPHPYLVLEYAKGGSLEEWILQRKDERASLDIRRLIEGIIRGLAHAHEKGIAHQDLKPANVLLGGDQADVPKIADFGLSRVEMPKRDGSPDAGPIVDGGTALYLPPEAMNSFAERCGKKNDVFAVGVIWYQLLTNSLERPPYDFADRLRAALVDSQTIRVIERCLAHPERRFTDAADLEEAFDAIPPVPDWNVPQDCFDVQHVAREYLAATA